MNGTFSDNLKLLQSYPIQDVRLILNKAFEIQHESYLSPAPRPKHTNEKPTPLFPFTLPSFTLGFNAQQQQQQTFPKTVDRHITVRTNTPRTTERTYQFQKTTPPAPPNPSASIDVEEDEQRKKSEQIPQTAEEIQYKVHPLEELLET